MGELLVSGRVRMWIFQSAMSLFLDLDCLRLFDADGFPVKNIFSPNGAAKW